MLKKVSAMLGTRGPEMLVSLDFIPGDIAESWLPLKTVCDGKGVLRSQIEAGRAQVWRDLGAAPKRASASAHGSSACASIPLVPDPHGKAPESVSIGTISSNSSRTLVDAAIEGPNRPSIETFPLM